jgi:hypothetical protein
MARVFTYLLSFTKGFENIKLFTIGTPAMGNKEFNKTIENSNCYNFLLDKDPIRLLPMCTMGFSHPNNLVNLDSEFTKYKLTNHLPYNYKFEGVFK